ncbi:MAG TPA: DUF2497 domain-containing protein [Afifellaceae bacterium]|nr:DUF2497 domain-containing protein [Afifellaceae bacterium]
MEEILASIRQIISEDGEQAEDEGESPEDGNESALAEAVEAELATPPAAYNSEPSAEEAEDASQPADVAPAPQKAAAPAATPPAPQPEHRPEPTLRRQPIPAQSSQAHQSQAQQPVRTAAATAPARQPTAGGVLQASPAAGNERRLLSPKADASVSGAFSALAHTILAQNARTLEDLVSEMLRPMLKEWLDDNLPPLVERLVKEEIERVSRGRH